MLVDWYCGITASELSKDPLDLPVLLLKDSSEERLKREKN
jgi:hypothetical protein